MFSFRTKIQSTDTFIWGGPGMAPAATPGGILLLRNDDTGEGVELFATPMSDPKTPRELGLLLPGSSYIVDLLNLTAVYGRVSGDADSFLNCAIYVCAQ